MSDEIMETQADEAVEAAETEQLIPQSKVDEINSLLHSMNA